MVPPTLPPQVQTFLTEHVVSVQRFQLLMRLVQASDRWWDAATAARELDMDEREAQAALDHFARKNLLDIRITGDVRYQYHPGNDELRGAVNACTDAFRRWPVQVLQLMTGSGRRSIRDFADAFRIRRDDDR